MKKIITIIFTLFIFNGLHAYKILMISLMGSKSHYNLNAPIADILTNQGHELTFITLFPSGKTHYREIDISEVFDSIQERFPNIGFKMSNMSMVEMFSMMTELQPQIAEMVFDNRNIQKMLNDVTEKFDLVIIEYFDSEYLLGLGVKYNCPVVILSPICILQATAELIGNPLSIATVPNLFFPLTDRMTLMQRIKNAAMSVTYALMHKFIILPSQKVMYHKYFPKESLQVPFEELNDLVSLVFVNTHPSFGISRPYLPKVIEIGGYHVNDPAPLPKDLQEIMDNSKHGVVYFSLGSILQGSELSSEIKDAIKNSLGKLKETVLWKYEEDIQDKPDNFIIRKWMPQTSILAHPNVKLFITHGGLLSCTESIHFGVPLIVIPVFGDQPHNANMIVQREQGLSLTLDNITESSLQWAVQEMLTNTKYTDNTRRLQKLYNDRPIKPRDLLLYYIEHVIRTKGAKHLSPPRLPRSSLLLLDVMAIVFGSVGAVLLLIIFVVRKCCCKSKKTAYKKLKSN